MKRKSQKFLLVLPLVLLLTACGLPTGDQKPDDSKVRDALKLMVTSFERYHPKLVNWDLVKVKAQIGTTIPKGYATEAGWNIKWPSYVAGELPSVVIPWSVVGQYPTKFAIDSKIYEGGNLVPQSVAGQIAKLQSATLDGGDEFFAATVNQRFSKVDSTWLIFTSVPYLPVTDIGYGFAHIANGQWKIMDFGTARVGCGVVPTSIESEFGFSCPTN